MKYKKFIKRNLGNNREALDFLDFQVIPAIKDGQLDQALIFDSGFKERKGRIYKISEIDKFVESLREHKAEQVKNVVNAVEQYQGFLKNKRDLDLTANEIMKNADPNVLYEIVTSVLNATNYKAWQEWTNKNWAYEYNSFETELKEKLIQKHTDLQ